MLAPVKFYKLLLTSIDFNKNAFLKKRSDFSTYFGNIRPDRLAEMFSGCCWFVWMAGS